MGSQVVGINRCRLPGRTVGKVKRGGEPATERRRKYTDFGSDFGERDEHVACHASALALAMADEAYREAEM